MSEVPDWMGTKGRAEEVEARGEAREDMVERE